MNPLPTSMRTHLKLLAALAAALPMALGAVARADDEYRPADEGQRPAAGGAQVLPEAFLRGYDPVTVYFPSDRGPGRGPADDGEKLLRIEPAWPGAWFWTDKRTLQFRPAEPWPALRRFAVDGSGTRRILTTMMSAPSSMNPPTGSEDLRPFRTVTLAFPQALPLDSLRQMLRLEIRDLPGLADSPRRQVKEFELAQLPRGSHRDAAVYAVTLKEDVPEGKQLRVEVSLALGDTGRTLWEGRLSTRRPFHLQSIRCGSNEFSLVGGASVPKDLALACGNSGELPQLVFSAPVAGLTLSTLTKLVRLEPAVSDLGMEVYGARVQLKGRFVPDTLYRLRIAAAPVQDDSGRTLMDPGDVTVFVYRGWKTPFLRLQQANAIVELHGPRMVPLIGYGDSRADVRVYKIDALHNGLWPFPDSPIVVNEESAPPFPGEEPKVPEQAGPIDRGSLERHLRLLGSPLVSKVVDLPLAQKSGTTRFGLDLGPLVDQVVGGVKPGTYLIGVRRLTGAPERAYMRVQVTNLSLTAVEERDRAVFFVRTVDKAEPVKNARITIDGMKYVGSDYNRHSEIASVSLTTDGDGRATTGRLVDWYSVNRVSVQSGDDALVLNPNDPPPRFAANHWSYAPNWLGWLTQTPPAPVNDKLLGFVFTERPIYRPGETVFLKGYVRRRANGELSIPSGTFEMQVSAPSGQQWKFPVAFTPNGGFSAEFKDKDAPTGDFTVQVYRKDPYQVVATRNFKIEAYRVPTFELQLSGPASARLDAPFQVKAVARYYAGGNVAGQPISWMVTRRPYMHVPKGRDGYLFASSAQFGRPGQSRVPDTQSRRATLDDSGSDSITVNPALDVDGSARVYKFEATVVGTDNQPVSATTEVKALPPFVLGMKLQRYMESATAIRPEIVAVGVDDQNVAGQDVLVRLYKRVWHSNLRETHFATGEAKYVTEQEDVKLLEKTISTDANKPVVPELPIQDAGVYVVELVARDKLGRVQSLSADLYIGGKGAVAWQKSREGVFDVTPDKKTYKPGETAKLVVQSPFQTGRALMVVEEPAGNTYTWRDVSGGKSVFDVKIQPQQVPNLPVHVVLMRGRLGVGEKEDGRFRPQTVASSLDLEIEPTKNQVKVQVAYPESVRPGSKADFTITLADDTGKAVGGEVTMWLVDEAVLSLAKEGPLDPLTAFIERNRRTSSVRDTRNLLVGKLFEQDEDAGGDGEEEEAEGAGGRGRVVRKNFQTVPYYAATLTVPASGKLVVPVQMSDDLTNFKVRAVAASGPQRFGLYSGVIKVRLPVLVQPQLPRLVRQGDTFWAGGVARLLEGAEGPGVVDINIAGPVDGGKKKQSVDLRANKAASVVFPLTAKSVNSVDEAVVKVTVGVTRTSDGQGDAFEVKIPVLPDRRLEKFAFIDRVKPGENKLRPFPETPRPGTAHEDFTFTAVPGVLELVSGLEYLASYPHGCLEQRLSQMWPEISQGTLLHSLGLDDISGPNAMVGAKQLLADLATHQDETGLFGYWPGTRGDLQLTANVVEFMARAKAAGLPVDEKVQRRATEALQAALRSDYRGLWPDYRWNQQTVALKSLTRAGFLDEHYLIELFHSKASMDPTSLADLAIAMSARPGAYQQNLAELKKDLWDSVVFKLVNGQPVFDGIRQRRSGWGEDYLGSDVSTIASVMEALLILDPADPRHAKLRDGLVSHASATLGFGSTYDNRRAISALAASLENTKEPMPNAAVTIVDKKLTMDSSHKAARIKLDADTAPTASVTGAELGVRGSYTYLPMTAGDAVSSLRQGILVSRSSTLVHADGTMDTPVNDEAGATKKLKVGDILELHARIQIEQDMAFVGFVVPFAAGLEPMNASLETSGSDATPSEADTTTPTYVQRLDGEVRYYFNHLSRGTHAFHFRVRAATEGSFVHPAPWAEKMYQQTVRGRGDGMRIVISGEHQQ